MLLERTHTAQEIEDGRVDGQSGGKRETLKRYSDPLLGEWRQRTGGKNVVLRFYEDGAVRRRSV